MILDELERQQDALLQLAERESSGPVPVASVASLLERLYGVLERAAASGTPTSELRDRLAPARAVHGRSTFVRRLQFPRGSAADFEACEAMLAAAPQPPVGTLARALEVVALSWPVVAQHRHVVAAHAAQLRAFADVSRRTRQPARVLVLGAGSAPEVRSALPALLRADVRVAVNDHDPTAIAFCRRELAPLGERASFHLGDASAGGLGLDDAGPFDLVLATGFLDHLTDVHAALVLRQGALRWLAPGGRLVASHLAAPCGARPLLDALTSWRPTVRSERQLRALLACAGPALSLGPLSLDPSGMTWQLVAGARGHARIEPVVATATTLPAV